MLGWTLDATTPSSRAQEHAFQEPKYLVGLTFALFRLTFSREKRANFRRCTRLLQLCVRFFYWPIGSGRKMRIQRKKRLSKKSIWRTSSWSNRTASSGFPCLGRQRQGGHFPRSGAFFFCCVFFERPNSPQTPKKTNIILSNSPRDTRYKCPNDPYLTVQSGTLLGNSSEAYNTSIEAMSFLVGYHEMSLVYQKQYRSCTKTYFFPKDCKHSSFMHDRQPQATTTWRHDEQHWPGLDIYFVRATQSGRFIR